MNELPRITTDPEPCPYLPSETARMAYRFVERIDSRTYGQFLARGWRRFGTALFRPECALCRECVPLRIPIADFIPSRSQRRVWRKNRDLKVSIGPPALDRERLDLHRRYHRERTERRGWPEQKTDPSHYRETFLFNAAPTLEFRYRLEGRLVAVSYVGEAEDALNAIYSILEPRESSRSLGTYSILRQIEEGRRREKQYLYLGFRIRGCRSMAYKSRFRSHELRIGERWVKPDSTANLEA